MNGQLDWLTKLAPPEALNRERFFLDRLGQQVAGSDWVPKLVSDGALVEGVLAQLTTERLLPAKVTLDDAMRLYQKMGDLGGGVFNQDGILSQGDYPPLKGGTPIRDMIVHWVKQPQSGPGRVFLQGFFERLKQRCPENIASIDEVQAKLLAFLQSAPPLDASAFGLIHGDFKPANILFDAQYQPKLIDCQYFEYGLRLWDLAFFLSKQKKPLGHFMEPMAQALNWSQQERRWLAVCYVLAVCLRLNPSNFDKQWARFLRPALPLINA
ncbi:phosphotransferase family protein [Thiomicrospira sp. WB1]|uniref:phosphotransferase family protein n=1 Tax=Thiomicrospira sp. WB1 TaxID=1685380 RepID=UPI0013664440|nr:phosphotransferase [Thiomicrospira sp. WB1]